MLVGRKYRLAFTPGQVEMAEEFGNICRAVWNTGLEQRREYRRRGAWVGYVQQAREVAEAKVEHSWLKAAPAHIPRHLSIERLGRKRARVRLPKFGWVTFRWSRSLGGAVKSATVTRDGKHWYVSFLVEDGVKAPAVSLERGRRGVDRGVVTLAATSDGRTSMRRAPVRLWTAMPSWSSKTSTPRP
ncbi:helix-turn-helix domain-containing protein [Streptomyces olivochromogenes]|uniref:helix-turn-helix domain-containing protein n=1 Tax=Streptomyces olivochromogenes TaxID=1963 RepID=UPI0036CA5203